MTTLLAALSQCLGAGSLDEGFDVYDDYEALLRTVESGAIAPLKGSYVLELYERGGRIKRRQWVLLPAS